MTNGFVCPNCAGALAAGALVCGSCGMRLSGPEYRRLFQVMSTIRTLETEASQLKAALLQPASVPAAAPPSPPVAAPAAPATRKGSGQQVILGLGALLLLAASSIFLLAVWFLVGVAGQAIIMLGLTGLAVQGCRLAARRGLDAASETGAVLATGLAMLDLLGARRFGLFDLDTLSPATFGVLTTGLVGLVLLGFDQLSVRTTSTGERARLPLTYRPAAAVLLGLAPWLLLDSAQPDFPGLGGVAGVLLVALAQGVLALGFLATTDRRGHVPEVGLGVAAGAAYALHLVLAFVTAHDVELATPTRYAALAFLLLPLGALAHPAVRSRVPAPGAIAAVLVVATVPLADLPGWGIVAAAAVLGAALAYAVAQLSPTAQGGLAAELWLVAGAGLALSVVEAPTLHRWEEPGPAQLVAGLVPLGILAVVTAGAAIRGHRTVWGVQAQLAVLALVGRAVVELEDDTRWGLLVALLVVEAALATVAARQRWRTNELTALAFGAGYVVAAGLAATDLDPRRFAATCFVTGIALVVYAAGPDRFEAAYLGAVANSLGGWVLTSEADVSTIEAYSFPLAAMLAVIGVVQAARRPGLPTSVTMGPVLGVLLGPSLLVAIGDGDALRLALVTAAGITSLMVGYAERWRAPVVSGALVLGLIGFSQGGPLLEYVPGWVILGLGGAVLLTAGVRFEAAVQTGRRGAAWFSSLT